MVLLSFLLLRVVQLYSRFVVDNVFRQSVLSFLEQDEVLLCVDLVVVVAVVVAVAVVQHVCAHSWPRVWTTVINSVRVVAAMNIGLFEHGVDHWVVLRNILLPRTRHIQTRWPYLFLRRASHTKVPVQPCVSTVEINLVAVVVIVLDMDLDMDLDMVLGVGLDGATVGIFLLPCRRNTSGVNLVRAIVAPTIDGALLIEDHSCHRSTLVIV